MTTLDIYRYQFNPVVPMEVVHACMVSAIQTGESIYGAARLRLEFGYCADDAERVLVADGRTPIGYLVICVFTGLLLKEFDMTDFSVAPVGAEQSAPTAEVCC